MSVYEDHCNSLADDAKNEYWDREFDKARCMGKKINECIKYANDKVIELDEHNLDIKSDWMC